MRCPSCSSEFSGFIDKCGACGFWAPGVIYYANIGSFEQWSKQINENKGSSPVGAGEGIPESICIEGRVFGNVRGSYRLVKSNLYSRYNPKNYNTQSALWSYENPKVLKCNPKLLTRDCHWLETINNRICEVVLPGGTAAFGDLLFATIDNERFYFILFPLSENADQARSDITTVLLEKSHIYYRYDPKNFNKTSPLWSYENPKELTCTNKQHYRDCRWVNIINGQKIELILLAGTASFGDLLFATINNERFYFILFEAAEPDEEAKSRTFELKKSRIYSRYDPKNFNTHSPLFSYENPMVLKCSYDRLKSGGKWKVKINDQDYEVSLPAGAASFGDLFFAIINEEHYFFLFLRD